MQVGRHIVKLHLINVFAHLRTVFVAVGAALQASAQRACRTPVLRPVHRKESGAVPSHRQAGNGTVRAVAYDTVAALDGRNELLEEEIFVTPARVIEIAHIASHIVGAVAGSIGHDDYHGSAEAGVGAPVGYELHIVTLCPGLVRSVGSVKQVKHRIGALGMQIVIYGQIDVVLLIGPQDLAAYHSRFDAAITGLLYPGRRRMDVFGNAKLCVR